MGADYIAGSLTAVLKDGLADLDWDAGFAYIETLSIDPASEEGGLAIELLGLDWLPENDTPTTTELINLRLSYRGALRVLLTGTKASLASREVSSYTLGPLVVFESGGMSWGDSPTDALDAWWKWTDDYMPKDASKTLAVVGFIPMLGSDNCPYEIVKKVNV